MRADSVDKATVPERLPGVCAVSGTVAQALQGNTFHAGKAISIQVPCDSGAPRLTPAVAVISGPDNVHYIAAPILQQSKRGFARLDDSGALIWQPSGHSFGRFGTAWGGLSGGWGRPRKVPAELIQLPPSRAKTSEAVAGWLPDQCAGIVEPRKAPLRLLQDRRGNIVDIVGPADHRHSGGKPRRTAIARHLDRNRLAGMEGVALQGLSDGAAHGADGRATVRNRGFIHRDQHDIVWPAALAAAIPEPSIAKIQTKSIESSKLSRFATAQDTSPKAAGNRGPS